jgi:succinoglycan biosynthesis transport protein ExoP
MTEDTPRVARYQSLRDYLAVVRRYWLMILIIVIIGAAAGLADALRQTPVYQANAQVAFQDPTQNLNIVGIGSNSAQTPASQAAVNATTATAPAVMTQVHRRLGTPVSVGALTGAVSTQVQVGSGLLEITASGSSPTFASQLANTVAGVVVTRDNQQTRAQFGQMANTVSRRISRLKPQAGTAPSPQLSFYEDELARLETLSSFASSAQVAKPAEPPSGPSSPKKARDVVLGGVLGLLLGIIAAFVRDSMDRRLRAPDDIESTFELPLVGHVRKQAMGRVPYLSNGRGDLERLDLDAFRILRRNVEFLDPEHPPKSILVTSAVAEEGKTTVAGSLALVLAAAGKQTLLVDCDLRRPDLAGRLGVEQSPGISEYLAGAAQPQEILRTVAFTEPLVAATTRKPASVAAGDSAQGAGSATTPNGGATSEGAMGLSHDLVCIPAGSFTTRGAELLGSGRFKDFIAQVTSRYDAVVIDSSPLLPVADTLEILPHVDAVVICVRDSQTTRDQGVAVKTTLARFPRRPTGVVITGIKPRGAAYEAYAYSYD